MLLLLIRYWRCQYGFRSTLLLLLLLLGLFSQSWCYCCCYWSYQEWVLCRYFIDAVDTKLCERAVAVTRNMNVLLLAACNPSRYAKLRERFCLSRVPVLMLSILSNWCVLLLLILLKVYYLKLVAAKQTCSSCSCWLLLLSKGLLLSRSSGRDLYERATDSVDKTIHAI